MRGSLLAGNHGAGVEEQFTGAEVRCRPGSSPIQDCLLAAQQRLTGRDGQSDQKRARYLCIYAFAGTKDSRTSVLSPTRSRRRTLEKSG
jgi:hypothetical protein